MDDVLCVRIGEGEEEEDRMLMISSVSGMVEGEEEDRC